MLVIGKYKLNDQVFIRELRQMAGSAKVSVLFVLHVCMTLCSFGACSVLTCLIMFAFGTYLLLISAFSPLCGSVCSLHRRFLIIFVVCRSFAITNFECIDVRLGPGFGVPQTHDPPCDYCRDTGKPFHSVDALNGSVCVRVHDVRIFFH